ncbi:MAG: hypothetical protein ACREQ2_17510 [Candidatus Binatia bacterium]
MIHLRMLALLSVTQYEFSTAASGYVKKLDRKSCWDENSRNPFAKKLTRSPDFFNPARRDMGLKNTAPCPNPPQGAAITLNPRLQNLQQRRQQRASPD